MIEARYLRVDRFQPVTTGLSSAFVWLSIGYQRSQPVATVVRFDGGEWSVLLIESGLESEFDADSDAMQAMIWWFGTQECVR